MHYDNLIVALCASYMLNALIVAAGGALGALCRYITVFLTQIFMGSQFPFGTLIVNSFGSLCIGFIMTLFVDRMMGTEVLRLFLVVGFLGGFTTFSSFTWETLSLYQNGQWFYALTNIILNNVLGIFMLILGVVLSRYISAL